jgi:hypothetical protein
MNKKSMHKISQGQSLIIMALLFLMLTPVYGLDLFTLWQQSEVPLTMESGARLDFRTMKVEQGRRSHGAVRIQCVGHSSDGWIIEIIPMEAGKSSLIIPKPVQAWQFVLNEDFLNREKDLSSLVSSVVMLDGTQQTVVAEKEWKSNPLVQTSFSSEFVPDRIELHKQSSRIVSGKTLMCEQLVLSADTVNSIELPRGAMEQTCSRIVTASVNKEIPLLGVAYVVEKLEIRSRFVSEKNKIKSPPPENIIETMELVDYGLDATSLFD